jgi:hypothetical protein
MKRSESYRVKYLYGCRLVFGFVTLSDFAGLVAAGSEGERVDLFLAPLTGVTLVII